MKIKNYFVACGIFLWSLSTLFVLLRLFHIAVFLEPSSIFWILFALSVSSFIVMMYKKANKKNAAIFIFGILFYISAFLIFLFKVGTIGETEYFHTICSDDGKHTVVIHEFQRPMHSGFAVYKKVFLNVYKCECLSDVRNGFLPFESGSCNYEWDHDLLQISFRRDENTEYKTVSINF